MTYFSSKIDMFDRDTIAELEKTCKGKMRSLVKDIVLRTPVDTGLARGNWQSSLGSPPVGTLEVTDKSGRLAIKSADKVIKQIRGGSNSLFCFANNLSYIQYLEDGWSKQAPNGMVKLAVASANEG